MDFQEGTVTTKGGTLIIKNDTSEEFTFGNYFSLEKKIDNDWYQVPIIIENYGIDDIGYLLSPSSSRELSVEWSWLHGELESGTYRYVKDFLYIRSSGDYDTYDLAAEFVIR